MPRLSSSIASLWSNIHNIRVQDFAFGKKRLQNHSSGVVTTTDSDALRSGNAAVTDHLLTDKLPDANASSQRLPVLFIINRISESRRRASARSYCRARAFMRARLRISSLTIAHDPHQRSYFLCFFIRSDVLYTRASFRGTSSEMQFSRRRCARLSRLATMMRAKLISRGQVLRRSDFGGRR